MILVAYTLSFLCLILNGSLFAHLKPPTFDRLMTSGRLFTANCLLQTLGKRPKK